MWGRYKNSMKITIYSITITQLRFDPFNQNRFEMKDIDVDWSTVLTPDKLSPDNKNPTDYTR